MTTTDENVVIAEFMGWEKSTLPNTPNKMYKGNFGIHVTMLDYDNNWNSLIPVFVKASTEIKSVSKRNGAYHNGPMLVNEAGQHILNGEIKEAHEKLFQAIQWHNENK